MNRRQFISRSAAVLAAGSIANQNLFAAGTAAPNQGRIGIQLYSVRNQLPKDVAGTLEKISEMGYAQVELYGINEGKFFGHSIAETKKMINDMGMTISSTHTGSGILPENINAPEWDFWKRIAGYLNTCGAKWAVASSLPVRRINTMDDLKRTCAHFNRTGEVCKNAGVKFAFHNHTEVFGKIENEIILDYMIKNTDPQLVFYQLDMGHTVNGGGDCLHYIRNYPGRIPLWHASDFNLAYRQYSWLGKGHAPYKELFDQAESSGLEVLTVEQETEVDTLAACKADFDFIKQFKWTGITANQAPYAGVKAKPNKGRIGIQLYSIKDELPKDFVGSLKKLSDMGYSSIEAYGFTQDNFFGRTMKELSNIVKDMGMTVSGSHIWTGATIRDTTQKEWDFWKSCAACMKSGDAKWAVLSSFPRARTLDDLKRVAEYFNRAGKICKDGGVKFAFHNHTEEFGKIDGEVILDFVIKNTDPELVFFQLDMGHVLNGGGDCMHYLRTFPNRIPLWHASDFNLAFRHYVEIGRGHVPYKDLFNLPNTGGLQDLTVEQETKGDIFASCKEDFDYLKQFKWTEV